MNIGERLTMLREEKGYMQRDVAWKLEMAANTLSGYERNLRKPDSETLIKLARFYNVSTDYLLGVTEIKTSDIYLGFAREAEENGIDPEDIKLALETIKKLRDKK